MNLCECRCSVLLAILLAFPAFASSQLAQLPIDQGWEFRQQIEVLPGSDTVKAGAPFLKSGEELSLWRPATVPGDIHLDLIAQKIIDDPFYGTNEAGLQWISQADWEYRTHFNIPPALSAKRHLELVFDGLDTYAHVYLNGKLILTADNQFRTWRVDVKPILIEKSNELLVVFPSPVRSAEAIAKRDPWFGRNTVAAKSYVRKAAYEYGWDWGPTFITSGIWKPVHLEGWDSGRIADFHVKQDDVSASVAHLEAQVEIEGAEEAEASVDVASKTPGGGAGLHVTDRIHLHAGKNLIVIPLEVDNPQRWFPSGYGEQPLYRFETTVRTGKETDTRSTRIGLRSLELRRDVDQWGRSFEFVVNGIPIYAKGASVIPSDSFYNRVTPMRYRNMLESAKKANMNMVRLWGGGYYEADVFYDLCDELGLMIWHDFMFGNEWQPGTYSFQQNVEKEAEDQLRRLRNHPSIVLWTGNNETETAFHWNDRDKLETATRVRMWQDYLTLFHGVLARTTARLDPEVPYWPSSPSADFEPVSADYESGDKHIWDVWHGRVPFETYETHHARFVSEYGFQSFPELRTVETFTNREDRASIFTPVMLAHQKNHEGNDIIQSYLLRDYSTPKDFASFLYVSQILQAEGVKTGAEHLRRERPRNMGSLYWQLNDCWPVASWSSIDSLGRWKALQYYARRFYAPVLVSPHLENGSVAVYIVSDRVEKKTGTLKVQYMRFDGTVLSERTERVEVTPLSSRVFYQLPLSHLSTDKRDLAESLVVATLEIPDETTSRNLTYLVPTKLVKLPPAQITISVEAESGVFVVRLHSNVLARSVELVSKDEGLVFADNFFDLLPGETRSVRVTGGKDAKGISAGLSVRSLADAFDPAAATAGAIH